MKKLILILTLLMSAITVVACGKKKDEAKSCESYPAGYIRVTDQRMLQILNGSGGNYGGGYNTGYNNNYNNNYNNQQYSNEICVDSATYQQLLQQVGGNTQTNCQQYPSAPGCTGTGTGTGTGGGNSDPYCDYYPEDPYCWGGYNYYY